MGDDDLSAEEQAAAEAARMRSSAQRTAADLARMGIDPRALGLVEDAARAAAPVDPVRLPAAQSPHAHNVVALHPQLVRPDVTAAEDSGRLAAPRTGLTASVLAPGVGPLEGLLGTPESTPASTASIGRFARSITFGMMTPDAADAAERERHLVNRVRTRQTDQRVVVFLSGKGGVGVSATAVGVGSVLAALRDDLTALVSLRQGTPSLGLALSGTPAPNAREIARTAVEVVPLALPNGLRLVDGPRWGAQVRRSDIAAILDRLGQLAITFSLFDVGNDASESGHSILSRADQVIIVSHAGIDGVDGARVAAERAADVDPYLLDSAIYVVVCHREAAMKRVAKAMRDTVPGGARVVVVPPEPSLAAGEAFDPSKVSAATRLAMIDVAGLVALGSSMVESRR